MTRKRFTRGLDPDPAVQRLVVRLHEAMERVPAPPCLAYNEPGMDLAFARRVTATVLYEAGPMRDWMLGLARELLAGGGERDVDGDSGPRGPTVRRAWDGTRASRRKPR